MSLSKKTTNIIAATSVAAAITTTSLFLINNEQQQWKMPDFPYIELPQIQLTSIDLPNISTQSFDIPNIVFQDVNNMQVETININNSNDIAVSSVGTTNIAVANVETVEIELQGGLAFAQFDFNGINLDSIFIPTDSFDTPTISVYERDWGDLLQKFNQFSKLCIDKRNLQYSKHLFLQQWLDIYKKYANVNPIKYIPLKGKYRMISQVRVPTTQKEYDFLVKNLNFYNQKGYNAALLVFRTNDDVRDLVNTARLIKQNNMQVFFAYGDGENLNNDVFCDPQWFENILTALAKQCIGYINWNRTALHLFIPDKAYNNYVHHTLRNANPNIYVLGQVFWGMTAIDHPKIYLASNVPTNCSGVLLINFGYSSVNIKKAIPIIRKKVKLPNDLPIMALVIGQKSYYLTLNPNYKSFKKNLMIKQQIEKEFNRNGIYNTMTVSDDGSNGIYNYKVSSNLSLFDLKTKKSIRRGVK